MSTDKEFIDGYGVTKLATRLGYSVQRVQNWRDRGIPAQVRLDHPDVFPLPQRSQDASQPDTQPQ